MEGLIIARAAGYQASNMTANWCIMSVKKRDITELWNIYQKHQVQIKLAALQQYTERTTDYRQQQ